MEDKSSSNDLREAAISLVKLVHENGDEMKTDGHSLRVAGKDKTWMVQTHWSNPSSFPLNMIVDAGMSQKWLTLESSGHYFITANGIEMLEELQESPPQPKHVGY